MCRCTIGGCLAAAWRLPGGCVVCEVEGGDMAGVEEFE